MTIRETYTQLGLDIDAMDNASRELQLELEGANRALADTRWALIGMTAERDRLQAIIDAMVDRPFGVCSHQLTFRASVYANDDLMYDLQDSLGNELVRDQIPMGVDTTSIIREHFNHGRSHHLTVGVWSGPNAKSNIGSTFDWNLMMSRLKSVADCVVEVAGVNEPDGAGRALAEYLPKVVAHQKALYERVKGDPATQHIKVGMGALRWANRDWENANAAVVAAVNQYMDFFNLHFYPGKGSDVKAELTEVVRKIRQWTDKPIVISEGGGTTANMTLDEQARICKDMLQFGAELGVKVYIYELMDDADSTGTVVQSNFGIFESDGSPKPAALAVGYTA